MDQPIFAKIPLDDVTLDEARALVDDPSFFEKTRIPILANFTITPADYWSLDVGTHREMWEYLTGKKLV